MKYKFEADIKLTTDHGSKHQEIEAVFNDAKTKVPTDITVDRFDYQKAWSKDDGYIKGAVIRIFGTVEKEEGPELVKFYTAFHLSHTPDVEKIKSKDIKLYN